MTVDLVLLMIDMIGSVDREIAEDAFELILNLVLFKCGAESVDMISPRVLSPEISCM